MKYCNFYPIKLSILFFGLIAASCAKNDTNPHDEDEPGKNTISNSLHIAFETPDWKREIDCSRLDLPPFDLGLDGEVFYVFASSESTRNTFMLSYPKYESELGKPDNIRKYPAAEFGNPTGPFQYGMKLPLDADKLDVSYGRLVSKAGNSETEFTEITEIKRVGTDGEYALYQIKGRYGFNSTLEKASGSETGKHVKGTFHLKVRALVD